jgi:hypothetical protein
MASANEAKRKIPDKDISILPIYELVESEARKRAARILDEKGGEVECNAEI